MLSKKDIFGFVKIELFVMRVFFLFCCFLLLGWRGEAQPLTDSLTGCISGIVVSDGDGKPLKEAHVFMGNKRILKAVSDSTGKFEIKKLSGGDYVLTVTYIGMQPWIRKVVVRDSCCLGIIRLQSVILEQVLVSARPPLSVQKGDTIQFNSAAIHLFEDADLENLLKKLPGFKIVNGKIMAQGQEVKKIYLDGMEYAINDPAAALKNLPAKLIARIKMFDDRSEEAKFSGYDDGNKMRTLHIETKDPDRMKVFGMANLGYGFPDLDKPAYNTLLSLGVFDKKRRISVDGNAGRKMLTDLPGAHYGEQGNQNRNWSAFANYSSKINEKLMVSGNFHIGKNLSNSGSLSRQEYLPTEDFYSRIYDQENHSDSKSKNQGLNLSVDFRLSDKDRLRFTPDFNFGKGDQHSISWNNSMENGDTLNRTEIRQTGWSDSKRTGGHLSWMHAFKKPGRTFTLQSSGRYDKTISGEYQNIRERITGTDKDRDSLRFQKNENKRINYSVQSGFSYSEPLSEFSRLSFNYQFMLDKDRSERNSMSYRDAGFENLVGIDTALTNRLTNRQLRHNIGLNYNFHKEKITLNGGGAIQVVQMDNRYQFIGQADSIVNSNYLDFSPVAELTCQISQNQSLSISYRGNTASPTAPQLQNVLDVSNPLRVSKGNPGLKKSYSHYLTMDYTTSEPEKSTFLWASISLNQMINQITSDVKFIRQDTIVNGYMLAKGGTLTTPVNLDGMWSIDGRVNYAFPVWKLRFDFGINYRYSHQPSVYDNRKNLTQMHEGDADVGLFADISENFDFSCRNSISYSFSENSSTGTARNLNESVMATLRWVFWRGLLVGSDYNFTYYWNKTGTTTRQVNNQLNFELGKKFGKKKQAELTFQVNDVFRERDQVRYRVTDLYSQMDSVTNTKDYYMLVFTYRFNRMGKD